MLRDFKFLRRNSGKQNEEIENEVPASLNPRDSITSQASVDSSSSSSSRPPLNTIQEPSPYSRFGKNTPTKPKPKKSESALPLRTPDKHRSGYWSQRNYSESRDEVSLTNGCTTPWSTARTLGRVNSNYSESHSTQSTPTKSVSKPPVSRSKVDGSHGGGRGVNYSASHRGIPVSAGGSSSNTVVNSAEVPHFDLKEDPSFWVDHNVQVLIRVRPLSSMEKSINGYNRCLKQESTQSITWIGQPEARFTFDHVACETVDQGMLFSVACLPMVENCLSGYNSCMFAYGQTGSGKTYTMLGEIDDLEARPSPHRGMTPRIFEFLFARIRAEEESRREERLKYNCKCSFLEIYNEQITDLLDPSSNNLLLREDAKKGVYAENLTEFEVATVSDILQLLTQGSLTRKVAATNMNRESSRSHSVFTCVIESRWEKDSTTNLRFARLNLVDLAGSERQKSSGAEGERLKEAANINKSLSTLGHVIMILVDVANGRQRHVPYRDSKLTFLLQDSLGGNSKTMVIANVSPSICCAAETLNTLRFAQRAKLIQNNAVVNEDSTGDVTTLQHQIRLLKEELSLLKRQNVSRSLAFVSTAKDTTQLRDSVFRDNMCEREQQLQVDGSLGCESKGTVRMSTKQLKTLETTLAGALRREQMAETCIKKLEAEIEQLNRLVRQREEDTRSSKMMLRFREDKIQRMESLLGGSLPQDTYLLEENIALREEIQLLQAKVDKNPEVTRFALENIRLLDQLRRFQEFYEEGEREILLDEVSKLREQLVHYLDGKALPHNLPNVNSHSQEAMCIGNDDSSLRSELKNALSELEKCRRNLNSCLEENQKLSRDINSLQLMIDNRTSSAQDEDRRFTTIKNEVDSMHDAPITKHAEEISDLQLEIMASREQLSKKELADYPFKQSMGDDSTLQIKLKRMQDSLEKAKKMNEWYQNDRTFQATSQEEMDEIRRQAEAETVEAIVSMQEELSILQQQVHECHLKEMETKRTLVLLETEMKELQEKLHRLNDDNQQLSGELKGKEEELRKASDEWELLACEMAEILSDGQDALADASDQLDLISGSFPEKRIWISEQVGKLIRVISEKELLIEELGKCLEDANNKRNDIECMLKSLRGAALVINEAHQQECDEKQKEIILLKSSLESKTSTVAELEDKVKLADLCASKASLCATAAFVIVNWMSEVNDNNLNELKYKDVQLGESIDMNQRNDFLLSSQAAAIKVAEDERQCLTMELLKLKETCSELQWQLSEAEKHANDMEQKLEDLEENNISKAREKLNELKTGASSLRSCMSIPLEHDRDPEADSSYRRTDAGEDLRADMLECTIDSCNENYKRTSKDVCDRGVTVILLKKELETALESLQEVKMEMAKLCNEKEEKLLSEKHSQESLKCFTAHLLTLQTAMSNFEKRFEQKINSVNIKLHALEQIVQETGTGWCQTKEFLEIEVSDSKIVATQKAAEVSCIFAKFEEAQEIMKEADIMINELMIANEAMKLDMERLKHIEITFTKDKDMLLNEVNRLQSINALKDQQVEDLEKQFGLSLMETNAMVIELEDTVGQIQATFKENFMSVVCDFNSFKTVLLDLRKVVGSWLEDVWSEIIIKDCAVSVLHLCHMGILLETLTGLSAENGLLQYGLCESNTIIADLREHNSKSSRELEMCRTLKGKLLADIKSSFDRISRKEEETGDLSGKITTFEKKIIDLQMQEEMMLQRSNYMASQLSILMKDLDLSSRSTAESLFDREKMMKDNEELLDSQAEIFVVDLCSKEIQSLVLASQLELMYLQKSAVENEHIKCGLVHEFLKEQMILLVVDGELKQEILGAKSAENALLLKEVSESQSQAQYLLSRITEMNEVNRALEMKVHQLSDVVCSNEVLKGELGEVLEKEKRLLNQVQALEAEYEKLLMDMKAKEAALESSSSSISILDQQNLKLQQDIYLLETSLNSLQTELDNKDAELNGISCLEEENKSLKDEVLKLKTQNSLVHKDLEKSTAPMESLPSHKNISDKENKRFQDRIFVLETLVASLESDLEAKDAEVNELMRSQSVVMADLSSKGQDLQAFSNKFDIIKNENNSLINELMSNKKFINEALIMSSLNTKKCLDSAENVGIIDHRLLNVLEKENNMVAEKIFDQLCEAMERTSKFFEEIQCLEDHAEDLVFENVSLRAELSRKDDILKGLLFDLSLIQESASNAKDQKDKIEQVMASFKALEDDLAVKSGELDEAIARNQMLEAELQEKIGTISTLELDFEKQNKSLQMYTCENQELRSQIEKALAAKCSVEEELTERTNLTESLEIELSQMGIALGQMNSMIESLRKDLDELTAERNQLQVEMHILKEKLGNAHAWAEENEAIALEAQQMAESKKIYAEEKEAEVKLLERSVEELECTVNVLENKADILKEEADRQRLQREEIENELLTLNHQMRNVKSVDIDLQRLLDEKDKNLEETLKQLQILERDVVEKDAEIAQCKAHISELNLHAEAQASEYKQKFKCLEAMAEQVKPEGHFFQTSNSSSSKLDKNAAKSRGSGSPFKCIGLGLAQQIKSERDEELTAARMRIEELESVAVSRQKEVFALNARLAAAESMTHDVIRDLLGVKLDMTNYMSLLDNQQLQKMAEKVQLNNSEPRQEQHEVMKLKKQLNEFIEERRGWLEEIDRKQAEMVAAQIALEKLRQRDQLLKTENEMLKMENVNNKKKLTELEGEVKKLSGQQNIQQRIHHHAKIKEENNILKMQNEDLSAKLKRTEFMLSRVKDELAHYRASIGKNSDINFDGEQQLVNRLKETEEDRMQIAQKLLGLCTSILKAAGITKPASNISPAVAEEALEQMKNRITSLERECQDLTFMNRINNERIRLSELMPRPSPPPNSRMEENCQTPRRSQTSLLSALER